MSKSFIEMERPQRTTEFVVIVREIEAGLELYYTINPLDRPVCGTFTAHLYPLPGKAYF